MGLRIVLLIIAVFFAAGIIVASYWRRRSQHRLVVSQEGYSSSIEAQEPTISDWTEDILDTPTIRKERTPPMVAVPHCIALPPIEMKPIVQPIITPKPESQLGEKVPMVVFYIMAKNEDKFAGFELLQCLTRYGLTHGPLGIFHYIDRSQGKNELLFSVASASEPGQFDIDRMGGASFSGICLFMNFNSRDPVQAFKKMLTIIQLMLMDLSGELFDDKRHPCNQQYLGICHRRILEHKTAQITSAAAVSVSMS